MLITVTTAGVAQSVERQTFNLVVEGSSPSFGVLYIILTLIALDDAAIVVFIVRLLVWMG